ncbi:steroid receptor RNA activator 1-like [Sycon ciliatum]|uniref:steroid receptor RNA activator 1-like n=1 Tax=Sycon ciliatum TaxID=27933 RepID=UPI0031F6105E
MASGKTGNKGWNDPPSIGGMTGPSSVSPDPALAGNSGTQGGDVPAASTDPQGVQDTSMLLANRNFIAEQVKMWQERCTPGLPARHAADMDRHLTAMLGDLEGGRLSAALEGCLHRLLSLLTEGDRAQVHDAQSVIILNHASEISSWMLGIKRLVHEACKQAS